MRKPRTTSTPLTPPQRQGRLTPGLFKRPGYAHFLFATQRAAMGRDGVPVSPDIRGGLEDPDDGAQALVILIYPGPSMQERLPRRNANVVGEGAGPRRAVD